MDSMRTSVTRADGARMGAVGANESEAVWRLSMIFCITEIGSIGGVIIFCEGGGKCAWMAPLS